MRVRWRVAVLGWLMAAGSAMAQTSPAPARFASTTSDIPPLGLPAALEMCNLPNGTAVSRPLQSVTLPPPAEVPSNLGPAEVSVVSGDAVLCDDPTKPLGRSWSVYEYLLWWPKASPRPTPLGGGQFDAPALSVGRFAFGSAFDESETVGLEVTYLFTGTRTTSASLTATEVGDLNAYLDNRMTGWEITGLANLMARPGLRLNALAGYRYFMVNEGLRLEQFGPQAGSMVRSADQIDAHNRFHGGQLGLHADWASGPVFVEVVGKVGIGQATNVVQASGQSVAIATGYPFPLARYQPGGVFLRPAGSGRFVHSGFAVLPEGTVKIGYRFRDRSRMYLGYNLLCLTEAVRPGDQVDTPGTGLLTESTTPTVVRSDFWVQGLIFGLEYRY